MIRSVAAVLLLFSVCCAFGSLLQQDFRRHHAEGEGRYGKSARGQLKAQLLKDYDPTVRPIKREGQPTEVNVQLTLIGYELSSDGRLNSDIWMLASWRDEFLTWKPSEYEGIDTLYLFPEDVWLPDLIPYNKEGNVEETRVRTLVKSSGDVLIVSPMSLKTFCKLDVRNWPFDEQTCQIDIGVWVYSRFDMKLSLAEPMPAFNNSFYVNGFSSEWDLLKSDKSIVGIPFTFDGKDYVYDSFWFTLNLKRISHLEQAFVVLTTLIVPLLVLASFSVPVNKPQRMTMSALAVLISILSIVIMKFSAPKFNGLPRAALLQLLSVAFAVISMIMSASLSKSTSEGRRFKSIISRFAAFNLRGGAADKEKELLATSNASAGGEMETGEEFRSSFNQMVDRVFFYILTTAFVTTFSFVMFI